MIKLSIGPEQNEAKKPSAKPSKYLVDLKTLDGAKKASAHSKVSLDMKEEIKIKTLTPDKIQIVGKNYGKRKGLGRIPMLVAALGMILTLNVGQLVFLGRNQGEQALALASEGFVTLQGAGQSFVSGEEGGDTLLFSQAQALFEEAKVKGGFLLNAPTPWLDEPNQVESLRNILDAGTLMSEVGIHLSNARTKLSELPAEGSITEYLRTVSETELEPASEDMNEMLALLSEVDVTGTGYETKFAEYQEKLSALSAFLNLWVSAKEPLLIALGDVHPQTYMVLLENNDEMRLGGGFIGSFVLVTLNDGRLTQMDFKDVYDYDGQYFEHQEVPVHELTVLTNEWRLRDSNVSPDFTLSAEKAAWFLELEGGPGVDGVIGVNLSAGQNFLEDTGALSIPSLQKALTAETFPAVISTLVEAKVNESAPKAILGELVTAFMEKTKDQSIALKLGSSAWEEVQKKQITFYHKNPVVQELLSSMGMSGELPDLNALSTDEEKPVDFFMALFTNIGGNKTDRYIETKMSHDTSILEDGSMVATVTLMRENTYNEGTQNWLKSTLKDYGFTDWNETLEKILGNAPNKTGIRLYVPEGAQLLGTQGLYRDEVQFFYDTFEDHSYFYFDQTLEPGESQIVTLQWALPWKFQGDFQEYKFQAFKQPGLKNVNFTKTVTAPNDILLSATPLASESEDGHDYVLSGPFNGDLDLTLLYR